MKLAELWGSRQCLLPRPKKSIDFNECR